MAKRTIPVISILIALTALACGEEKTFGSVLDDALDDAPDVCKELCEESIECEYYANDSLECDALELLKNECVLDCAYQLSDGCYVLEVTSTDESLTPDYEMYDSISSDNLLAALECVWNLDVRECVSISGSGRSRYKLMSPDIIASSDDCNEIAACYDLLVTDKVPVVEWVIDDDSEDEHCQALPRDYWDSQVKYVLYRCFSLGSIWQ